MRIGILGGSFNPVHAGHVRMAVEVLERLELDRVELVPAKQPPPKDGSDIMPFDLRMKLVEQAIGSIPGLGVNPLEGDRPGPSFTCDTLQCYRTEQPDSEAVFILGASTFLELPKWRRGLEIPDLASMAVVSRWDALDEVAGFISEHWPGAEHNEEGLWTFPEGHTVQLIEIPRLDIKGGHIRRRWLERRNLSLLLPPGVEALLDEHEAEIEGIWGKRA